VILDNINLSAHHNGLLVWSTQPFGFLIVMTINFEHSQLGFIQFMSALVSLFKIQKAMFN